MGRGYQSRRTSGKVSHADSVSPNEAGAEGYSHPPLGKEGSDIQHLLGELVEMSRNERTLCWRVLRLFIQHKVRIGGLGPLSCARDSTRETGWWERVS